MVVVYFLSDILLLLMFLNLSVLHLKLLELLKVFLYYHLQKLLDMMHVLKLFYHLIVSQ